MLQPYHEGKAINLNTEGLRLDINLNKLPKLHYKITFLQSLADILKTKFSGERIREIKISKVLKQL